MLVRSVGGGARNFYSTLKLNLKLHLCSSTNKIDVCSLSTSAILGLALMYYKSFLLPPLLFNLEMISAFVQYDPQYFQTIAV